MNRQLTINTIKKSQRWEVNKGKLRKKIEINNDFVQPKLIIQIRLMSVLPIIGGVQ